MKTKNIVCMYFNIMPVIIHNYYVVIWGNMLGTFCFLQLLNILLAPNAGFNIISMHLVFFFQICTCQTCTHIIACIVYCVFAFFVHCLFLYYSFIICVFSCHCHSVTL